MRCSGQSSFTYSFRETLFLDPFGSSKPQAFFRFISACDKSFDLTVAITKYNNSRGYLLSLEIKKYINHHWILLFNKVKSLNVAKVCNTCTKDEVFH